MEDAYILHPVSFATALLFAAGKDVVPVNGPQNQSQVSEIREESGKADRRTACIDEIKV